MLAFLRLLLPALIPSWRFFETIEPSPRVQWAILSDPAQSADQWQDYRPHAARLSFWTILGRLFWNPHWNEGLYMVSLAERLSQQPTVHSVDEIFRLIRRDLIQPPQPVEFVQFRLVFVQRDRAGLTRQVTYLSAPRPREAIP